MYVSNLLSYFGNFETAAGSLSDVANQMGFTQMEGPLKDMGRQVSEMSSMVGGVTGGPITDSAQALADEVAAWMGVGGIVISGRRALLPPSPPQSQGVTRQPIKY